MSHINNILKNLKDPFVILLIGPPLSGKSTWIRNNFSEDEVVVISRDQIVLDEYGSNDYDKAFHSVNQKRVDAVLQATLLSAIKNNKNVIIDMTHMGRKRRMHNLSNFPKNYYKMGVIFPTLTEKEFEERNSKRSKEENKTIGMDIVKRMLSQYQPIDKKMEGFDKIVSL